MSPPGFPFLASWPASIIHPVRSQRVFFPFKTKNRERLWRSLSSPMPHTFLKTGRTVVADPWSAAGPLDPLRPDESSLSPTRPSRRRRLRAGGPPYSKKHAALASQGCRADSSRFFLRFRSGNRIAAFRRSRVRRADYRSPPASCNPPARRCSGRWSRSIQSRPAHSVNDCRYLVSSMSLTYNSK